MANRSYKYRIYPTKEQAELINKTIGCCRQVYNTLLADCIKQYEDTGKSKVDSYKPIRDRFDYMKEVDAQALNYSRYFLNEAFQNFFKSMKGSRKGRRVGYPKFHRKSSEGSYTTYGSGVRLEDGKMRLPKVGLVRVVRHRKFEGTIKHVTISRTPAYKYYISLCTNIGEEYVPSIKERRVVGIDMSYKELAVYSDGTSAGYPKYMKKYQRQLAHAQRTLSRRKGSRKGEEKSSNWRKTQRKVNAIYEKIRNSRKDFLDKESARISSAYDVAVVEDINMQDMANRGFGNGKTVNDIAFGTFRTMLEYKLRRKGGELVKADRWYPSSQLCSVCGFQNHGLKDLRIRKWTCPECGTEHDRDINAAVNLRNIYVPPLQRELMPVEGLETKVGLALADGGDFDEAGKMDVS